ncbi:MAG: DUF4124 domain-containing protein [Pseudomonadota bacterium]
MLLFPIGLRIPRLPAIRLLAGWVGLVASSALWAQTAGIYTCTDSKGRKLTADRPIAECVDRSQQELNQSGTVKRVIGPSLTAVERAALEEKQKIAAELVARQAEEKRRDRALLLRYPNRSVHDRERGEAIAQIDEVIKASAKRAAELTTHRRQIDEEFEFYKSDVSKAPAWLKRKLEDNQASVGVQKRFQLEQEMEKKRVNARFDEELVKLSSLWAATAQVKPGATALAAPAK